MDRVRHLPLEAPDCPTLVVERHDVRPSDATLSFWLVRRTHRADGRQLTTPRLWGKVLASSDTVAVQKFVNMLGSEENSSHFDAVPANGRV